MHERLKDLFEEAIGVDPVARERFVSTACRGDASLRDRLLQLLRAHDRAGDFLAHPADLVEAAAHDVGTDDLEPGQRIGAFTLRACLGRGGFGSVWRARQEQPVARDVALKVLHAGFDAEGLTMRFLVECRTLARMQHPAIAKVFDAGTEPSGTPWLAMELIDGQPLTAHCAAAALDWRARVELLVEVCLAVQHAHHKGIVHRDLKPSNVLVTLRDGRAQPVVIDFGVARDLEREAAADGEPAQVLGTIEYMSPEQTTGGGSGVDARTDVYSLGVLLYELLGGALPFVRCDADAGPQDLLRRIRTAEPPPPSRLPTAVPRLPREVDWIAARALAKDPDARYPTAAALGEDLRRLLACEPVAAGSPGALYRVGKFARRHRLPVAFALTLPATLALGAVVAAAGWVEARASAEVARVAALRARADQQAAERESRKATRALDLLDELWEAADPSRFGRADYRVRELFADFEHEVSHRVVGEPVVELRVRLSLGRIQRVLGMLDSAEAHAARAVELARASGDPDLLVEPLLERTRTQFERGEFAAAEATAREALALLDAAPSPPALAAQVLEALANCRHRLGDTDAAVGLAERALRLREQSGEPPAVGRSLLQLANLHGSVGRTEDAMELLQDALEGLRALGPDHPDAIAALQHLALLQQRQGDFAAAEASYREGLDRRQRLYGDDHQLVAWAQVDLAWLLHEQGGDAAAVPLLEAALPVLRERLGDRHLYVSEAIQRLGTVLAGCGRLDDAEPLLADAATRFRTLPGHPVDGLVGCLGNVARLQWRRGLRSLARETMQEAATMARAELPPDHFVVSVSLTNLGTMLAELGEVPAAVDLLEDALARSSAAGRLGEAGLQRQRLAALRRQLDAR